MFFSDTKTALEWTCYHSCFSDVKSKNEATNLIGICIGFTIGWVLAQKLDLNPPFFFMVLSAAFIAAYTLNALTRIVICRDLTIIMPDEGDVFKYEITDNGTIIWHSVMEDDTVKAVNLYEGSIQIKQVVTKSELWYEIMGKPGKRFIEVAKESETKDKERCYAITNLCLHIRRSALDSSVSAYFDALCESRTEPAT